MLQRLMAMSQPREGWFPLLTCKALALRYGIQKAHAENAVPKEVFFLARTMGRLTVRSVGTAAIFVARYTCVGSRRHHLVLIGR